MQKLSKFLVFILLALLLLMQLANRQRREQERRRSKELLELTSAVHAFNDGGPTLAALEDLRAGNTNAAIGQLESKLYRDVYEMHYFYKEHPEQKLDTVQRELLTNIRTYEERFPGDTYNPPMDQLVSKLLSMTNPPPTK